MRNAVAARTLTDIRLPSLALLGKVFDQDRIELLNVADETVRRVRDPATGHSRNPHQRSVRAVPKDRTAHHVDLRGQLAGHRFALRLVPVEYHLLLAVLLDEIAIHRDGRVGCGQYDRE